MSTTDRPTIADLIDDFGAGWNRFWYTPSEVLPCCVLRIVVGLLAAAHFLDLGSGLGTWYSADGVFPPGTVERVLELTNPAGASYRLSYLAGVGSGTVLSLLHGLAVAIAVLFAAGLAHRITGVILLLAVLAYVHRAPLVAGHLEPLLSFLIAYLIIAPAGACLSLDRWLAIRRSKRAGVPEPVIAPAVSATISLRLIQVHLAMFYAMMGLTKLYGDAWWEGTAMWILLAQTESRPLDLTGLRKLGRLGEYGLNFWTHFVVYFELAFGVLIWTRLRELMLALSVVVWMSMLVATGHVLFSLTMLAAGMAFVPAERFCCLGGCRSGVLEPLPMPARE